MNVPLDALQDMRILFRHYLHQDWSIDGDTLEEIFETNEGFGDLKEGSGRWLNCLSIQNSMMNR